MTNFDDYFVGDEVVKLRAYKEFNLEMVDEANLNEIEHSLNAKKLNKHNCKDSLEYLEDLFRKIQQIKANEYSYEGDANLNVNTYLERIKTLIIKIKQL
jgi:hypothetical protein